jgi:phage nucleotide-binding protein
MAKGDVPFEIFKLNEQDEIFLNIFIYGKPGVGKTYLAATAEDCEEMLPILLLDVDSGTLTIKDRSMDVTKIMKFSDIDRALTYLENNNNVYKTVILDTFSEIQRLSLRAVMADVVRKKPDRDPDWPAQQDWGKSTEQLRNIVRRFRDLPMHVIITCHEKEEKEETGAVTVKPMLPGKLADEIPSFFDIVGRLYTKTTKTGTDLTVTRLLRVQPDAKIIAKDRSDKLGVELEDPRISDILDALYGEVV